MSDINDELRAAAAEIRGLENIVGNSRGMLDHIITSRDTRDRYAATLERLARERNQAAYEWTRLHWWQWRKRRRLWRVLYGVGGWRAVGVEGVPERVARCGRFIKRYREGGC